MGVYSITVTNFRLGVILLPPHQNKPLKSPPRLGLKARPGKNNAVEKYFSKR